MPLSLKTTAFAYGFALSRSRYARPCGYDLSPLRGSNRVRLARHSKIILDSSSHRPPLQLAEALFLQKLGGHELAAAERGLKAPERQGENDSEGGEHGVRIPIRKVGGQWGVRQNVGDDDSRDHWQHAEVEEDGDRRAPLHNLDKRFNTGARCGGSINSNNDQDDDRPCQPLVSHYSASDEEKKESAERDIKPVRTELSQRLSGD
jgi:hypothetical protein